MNSEIKNIKKVIVSQSLELDCGKTIKNFPLEIYNYIFAVKGNYWV